MLAPWGRQELDSPPQAEISPLAQVERPARTRSLLREILETVLLTVLIFAGLRMAFRNFRIEGQSMEPNFHDGQFLVVNHLVYLLQAPARGEVAIFLSPESPDGLCKDPLRRIALDLALLIGFTENNPCRDFIKRIIGLPGEEVEIRSGRVFINGQRLQEPYVTEKGQDSWGPKALGADEYFVLGDNRTNSSDSRHWGSLPPENIVGQAWISYWPPAYWGLVPHYSYAE